MASKNSAGPMNGNKKTNWMDRFSHGKRGGIEDNHILFRFIVLRSVVTIIGFSVVFKPCQKLVCADELD